MGASRYTMGRYARMTAALLFASTGAQADIYNWIDASGSLNVSNIAPPEDVRVTKVVHEAPKSASRDAAAEAARTTQLQALNERVGQLERELQAARSTP